MKEDLFFPTLHHLSGYVFKGIVGNRKDKGVCPNRQFVYPVGRTRTNTLRQFLGRLHGTTIYCHDVMAHLMEGNGKIGGEASCANQYDLHQNLLRCTFSHFSRSSF